MPIPDEHQQHIDRYSREFEEALEKVAMAALADRTPARLVLRRRQRRLRANRRTKGGPVDHDLPVLVVKGTDGKLLAIWTSYACHCVTLSDNKISGDWAGYAQERSSNASIPGAIGAGLDRLRRGCESDSGVTGDKADIAEAQGLEIAEEVQAAAWQPSYAA